MATEFYFDETDLFPYRPISPCYMVTYILSSFVFFSICNQLIIVSNDDHNTVWLRKNTLLSFFHSLLCSALLIIGVARAPEMFEDPLSHSNHFNYALLAFAVGYFLYDFVDCVQNSTTSVFPILVHHVIVVTFLTHVLYHTRNVGYALYGLSLEINSVFLHARRLLRWYSTLFTSAHHKQLLKIFVEVGNYITFIVLRFGVVLISFYQLYYNGLRVHPLIWMFIFLITSAMGGFNMILFYRLVKNQVVKKPKSRGERRLDDNVLLVNNHILLPS